jgi:hypothetical protein
VSAAQCILQDASVIDPRVVRGIQQGHRLAPGEFAQLGNGGIAPELTRVPSPEDLESLRVVLKPLAQWGTGRDVLHP